MATNLVEVTNVGQTAFQEASKSMNMIQASSKNAKQHVRTPNIQLHWYDLLTL